MVSTQKRTYELKARADRHVATRHRIVEATVALHQEVGPAYTTVAEIARRAGVQRLTVYNHFPEERGLFTACQAHFLSQHPGPDLAAALALTEPAERVLGVLRLLYPSYRSRAPMTANVLRDRSSLPALNDLLELTLDAQNADLSENLTNAFALMRSRRKRLRALIGLSVDFSTWQHLAEGGLSDSAAAQLMSGVISREAA